MKQVDFSNGKIGQNIAQTAFPMLVAQILNLLYSIVDRVYVARIPGVGTAALGGMGLCFPVIIVITGFTNLFGMGGSPLFSIELGRQNHKKAAEIQNSSFRLLIVTAVILLLFFEAGAKQILYLFGATDDAMVYALPYMRCYLLGTLFSMISTGMNPFINGQGFASIGMITVTVGAVTNLILDPIFIYVLGLGVVGAAAATVISQGLSAFITMRFLLGKQNTFRLTIPEKGEKLFPYARDIVGLGLAPFIMQFTNSLVSIVCNNVLIHTGGAMFVSIMTIISSVRQILDTVVLAIANGTSPIISYNYGARKPANVRKAIMIMTVCCISYTVVVWVLIQLSPSMFVHIFSSDESLMEECSRALHLYFLAFIFQALQCSGQSTFKALGKKKRNIFFSLFRKVIMVVPLTYALPYLFHMGTDGVFMAEPISNFIGGSACFITMLLTVLPELKAMEQQK